MTHRRRYGSGLLVLATHFRPSERGNFPMGQPQPRRRGSVNVICIGAHSSFLRRP